MVPISGWKYLGMMVYNVDSWSASKNLIIRTIHTPMLMFALYNVFLGIMEVPLTSLDFLIDE